MDQTVILTAIGPDRPGLTEILADAVLGAGGNWLESRLSSLGTTYAGAVLVRVPKDGVARLEAALDALASAGLRASITAVDDPAEPAGVTLSMELVGQDRPGIVREVSSVLARHGVNILNLETRVESAAWSGGALFRAEAELRAPPGLDLDALSAALERISAEIMADITLSPASD